METPEEIRKRFLSNSDEKYRSFSETCVVPKNYTIIGIRNPVIREFAKEICSGDWRSYLHGTEDEYYEDVLLRSFIIAQAKMEQSERHGMIADIVRRMDNWAICDSLSSALKVNKKNADDVWYFILPFLGTKEEFQIRFTIAVMLFHFVNEKYVDRILQYMDTVKNDKYYVKMAVAWCLSVCFIKFPDITMTYLKNNTLDTFTFNKTLSKITDSFRVSDESKVTIRKMRRK
ncbi:MAG: DNA alkylation repair protein [Methanomassiliicoccaceae archaeon]|nr:DNA alkylation repair protein [Methanomassiliicoccaceae archaeon]